MQRCIRDHQTESRNGTAEEARAVCGALNVAHEYESTMGRQQQRSSKEGGRHPEYVAEIDVCSSSEDLHHAGYLSTAG